MSRKQICLWVFLIVWLSHFLSKTITVTDSVWTLPLSVSIERGHKTSLDDYKSAIEAKHYYAIEIVNEDDYYFLPVGTSLLIAPMVKALDVFCKKVLYLDVNDTIKNGYGNGIELFFASLLVAVTSVFIFLIAFEITAAKWQSVLAVFVFAFCTSAWSTGSRALWSHTASMLMLSIALFALLRAKQNQRWLIVAGLALAYSYVVRPTNSLSIIFFSLYVVAAYRQLGFAYFIGLGVVLFPFVAYNYHIYHHLLSTYYTPGHLGVGGNSLLKEALLSHLFSPARGLFVFSPVLVCSVLGAGMMIRNKIFGLLDVAVLLIILSHYYVISSISTPFAGWSFGPRYFCDMMPFFIYFFIFFVSYLVQMNMQVTKYALAALLLIAMSTSFFINYKGATHPATFMWNAQPDIDTHPERVWDWNDLQFMR